MKMETSLYHDEGVNRDAVRKLKRTMTLDFASEPSAKKPRSGANVLSSPDLKLLQLASPELERMIIQQNGMVTTTPTPTQFLCPKYVTEEQEAYARGFVDALNELHNKKEGPDGDSTEMCAVSVAAHLPVSQLAAAQANAHIYTTSATSALPGANTLLPTTTSSARLMQPTAPVHQQPQPVLPMGVLRLKEEPQTVPNCSSPAHITPIDMGEQEVIKLERKRERNRVAARKCRNRKLDRISKLEERVNELKNQNTTLATSATGLRDQVCKLKQQIMEHVSSGCQVMLSQNIL